MKGWLVAGGLELGDQPLGFPLGVRATGEVAGAGLLVGLAGGQDVPGDGGRRVGGRGGRFVFRGRAAAAAGFRDVAVVEGLGAALAADG